MWIVAVNALHRKNNGIHYTPKVLSQFLAHQICSLICAPVDELKILDPACGNGSLLNSIAIALPSKTKSKFFGLDTSANAVRECRAKLGDLNVELKNYDFLKQSSTHSKFDIVVANPPYVRTQNLGGLRSKALAEEFGLSGRIDLYQAFAAQIAKSIRPGGLMGLIIPNRFLTTKTGKSMRGLLAGQFSVKSIVDLGDTRLFNAAVLPAIVIAVRKPDSNPTRCRFTRIYYRDSVSTGSGSAEQIGHILAALGSRAKDRAVIKSSIYQVEEGFLEFSKQQSSIWSLTNSKKRKWIRHIQKSQSETFGGLAEVKVGIKTTADSVFIRQDWPELGKREPESELLLPLITHHDASRWQIDSPKKKVLYPYGLAEQKRCAVDLKRFPKTKRYLQSHRQRLEGRKYVTKSGREWFEIWVPHQPVDWAKPKIVWPDISEQPKFFLDSSGAIVNGDCYWIKLREEVNPDWLYVMLAVANSTVATTFYDTVFHNKLYANRRRFMTQYVKEFPLPDIDSKIGKQIIRWAKKQVEKPSAAREAKLESLVQRAFGF